MATIRGAATARGSASLTGDLSGYDALAVGAAQFSGRAEGRLTVDGGDVGVGRLDIGTTLGTTSATVIDGELDASGHMTLRRGTLGTGDIRVGATLNPVPGLAAQADSTLALEDATLRGDRLSVGAGAGASGELVMRGAGGSAGLRSLDIGQGDGASGSVVLEGGRLSVNDADPVVGSINVGSDGGHARLWARDAEIEVSGFVGVGGFTDAGGDGRLQLVRSSLRADGAIVIGDTGAASIAELSLEDSSVSTAQLQMGRGADSRLIVDASTMFIDSFLGLGDSTSLTFGIDDVMAGVGGHGRIDADYASLAGDLFLDFSDLSADRLPGDAESHFDLITGRGAWGLFGDFASVNVIAASTGYGLRWGTVMDGVEVWRVTLTRLDGGGSVPEPTPLGLLGASVLAGSLTRRRRRVQG